MPLRSPNVTKRGREWDRGWRSLDGFVQGHRDGRNFTEAGGNIQHCCCCWPQAGAVPPPLPFASAGICFFWSQKKCIKTSISYRTFKVTCIKCTKSTFLLMEWPFDNEVISDITAGEKGGFLPPFLPFCKPSEVANFVTVAVCAQYFTQLHKVMWFFFE